MPRQSALTPRRPAPAPSQPAPAPQHGGRWQHVYRLWDSALKQETLPQFDRWLSEEFKRNASFGARDRKWYADILFAGIRYAYFAVFCERLWRNSSGTFVASAARRELTLLKSELTSTDSVIQAFRTIKVERLFVWIFPRSTADANLKIPTNSSEGTLRPNKNQSEIMSEDKTKFFADLCHFLQKESGLPGQLLYAGVPVWFTPWLEKRSTQSHWTSEELARFVDHQNVRPPLWLRLNHPDRYPAVEEDLKKDSFIVERFGNAVRVTGARGIFVTECYRTGTVEIQDFASQGVGSCVRAKPGEFVWDACSGGGGKTQQLAAMLSSKGAVYASDIREYKLDEVRKRARRAGFSNVRCIPWSGEALPKFPLEIERNGGFDWVLVDAPCSSSGTWRRNPDAKLRADEVSVQRITALQLQILSHSAAAVKLGGCIVYATCSWLVQENEDIVATFVRQNPEFSVISQEIFGSPKDDADTMFAAVLRRNSAK